MLKEASSRCPYAPWLALTAILVLSSLLDLIFFTGYFASDDRSSYLAATQQVLTTSALREDPRVGQTRLPIVAWNVLVASLFGYDAQIIAASYIAFHHCLTVLTFLLGKRLFGSAAGVVAAYCVGTYPRLVLYASLILPDVPQACFIVLSLLLFVICSEGRHDRARLSYLCALGSGASVGLAYMCKESGLVLLPFYFIAWLVTVRRASYRKDLIVGASFLVGFLAMFALEWAVLSLLTGRSFFRLGWLLGGSGAADASWKEYRHGYRPSERLAWFAKRCLAPHLFPLVYKIVFAGSLLIYPFLPRRRLILLLFPLYYFVYYTWGSASFREYIPPSIQERYYIPLIPFVAAISGFVLVWLFRLLVRPSLPLVIRRGAVVLVVCSIVPHLIFAMRTPDSRAGRMYRSELVGNVARAVHYATEQRSLPVLLANVLHWNASPVLRVVEDGTVLNARSIGPSEAQDLLAKGPLLYIQRDPREATMPVASNADTFDALMLSALKPDGRQDSGDPPVERMTGHWRFRSDGRPARVVPYVGGSELTVAIVATFTAPCSRLEGLWQTLAPSAPVEPGAGCQVMLYEVAQRRARTRPASRPSRSYDLAPRLSQPGSSDRPKYIGTWKAWRDDALKYRVTAGDDGVPTFVLAGPPDLRLTLLPQRMDVPELCLEANRYYRLEVEVALSDEVQASAIWAFYSDAEMTKLLLREQTPLPSRTTVAEFSTEGHAVYLKPVFRVAGEGRFTLKRLLVAYEEQASPEGSPR